jgi:hypothetical protein
MLNTILYDPLEQFEVYPLFRYVIDLSTFHVNSVDFFQHLFLDLSITNFVIYTSLIIFFSYGLLMHIAYYPNVIPTK